MKKKKTLVISHNIIGSNNNMGITLDKLFSNFADDLLCQISFRNEKTERTHSNLVLTDKDALKSVVIRRNFWKIGSKRSVINALNQDSNHRIVKKSLLKLIMRDLIWKISKWKTKKLTNFIEENNIERIIVAPGYSLFIYNIAMYIKEYLDVQVISYFADDYYESIGVNTTVFANAYQRILKSKINDLVSVSDHLYCISEPMTKYYSKIFNKSVRTLYTPNKSILNTDFSKEPLILKNRKRIIIGYIGNLSLGRFEEILKFVKILRREDLNELYDIKVYGQLLPEQEVRIPNEFKYVFKGLIDQIDTAKVESEFDILLHVESHNPNIIERVKNSFSTKLSGYLASGKQLLLIGPKSVHSISYFLEYELGYVITDLTLNEVISTLTAIKNDTTFEYIHNAKKIAIKNHTKTFKDYLS